MLYDTGEIPSEVQVPQKPLSAKDKYRLLAALALGLVSGGFYLATASSTSNWRERIVEFLRHIAPEAFLASTIIIVALTFLRGATEEDEMRCVIETMKEDIGRIKGLVQQSSKVLDESTQAQVVIAEALKSFIASMWQQTDFYKFVGNTGRHFTAKTLPALAEREELIRISCQFLDPRELEVCRRFALERAMEADDLIAELYASVVLVYLWAVRQPRLKFDRIGLRRSSTPLRIDHTTHASLITSEGKDDPGLAIKGTGSRHFHRHTEDVLNEQLKLGTTLPLPADVLGLPRTEINDQVTDEHVKYVLKAVNLTDREVDIPRIAAAIRGRRDPYRPRGRQHAYSNG